MDLKGLRKRCEARIRELDLPTPFNARFFCDTLASRRGRPIQLLPIAGRDGLCGLWVATSSTDYIFFERATTPFHQEHIILHEASHLLCDHRSAFVTEADLPRLLFPDLRPEMVHSVLQRATYSIDEEREAELLASLILERSASVARSSPAASDSQAVELIGRLESSLEEAVDGQF